MKEMVCIICPKGCHIGIDPETLAVTGNTCEKGEQYARDEITHPLRTVTSTVRITGGIHPRLPVRTDSPVPKESMSDIMNVLHAFTASAPVKRGDILIDNIAGTGANIIASRDM